MMHMHTHVIATILTFITNNFEKYIIILGTNEQYIVTSNRGQHFVAMKEILPYLMHYLLLCMMPIFF